MMAQRFVSLGFFMAEFYECGQQSSRLSLFYGGYRRQVVCVSVRHSWVFPPVTYSLTHGLMKSDSTDTVFKRWGSAGRLILSARCNRQFGSGTYDFRSDARLDDRLLCCFGLMDAWVVGCTDNLT